MSEVVGDAVDGGGGETVTHFSLVSSLTATDPSLSDSSSDVTLSSVSASMPVLFSDSELEDSLAESSEAPEADVELFDEDSRGVEESPCAASERAFFVLERDSLRSSF